MDNIFFKFFVVLCFPVYLLDGYIEQFPFFDGWLGAILILVLYPTWIAIVLVFGYMLYEWWEYKDFNRKPKDIEKLKPPPLPDKKMLNGYQWELKILSDGKKYYRSSLGEYLTIEKFKEELEEERLQFLKSERKRKEENKD